MLDAVNSGWISSLGRYVTEFEDAFAAYCGAEHGVSTSNGTTALHLALHALGIGPGDEVIVPALTFVASANAVAYTGARPVFADVDAETWSMLPEEVDRLLTERTRAVMPVHLYGHPAAMHEIMDLASPRGIWVLEDAAEAHGAQVGTRRAGNLGHAGSVQLLRQQDSDDGRRRHVDDERSGAGGAFSKAARPRHAAGASLLA